METKNTIICSKCLEKISDERICPLCGNDNSIDNPATYLKAFTMLQDKYIVGKLISTNGEHALYIAFDIEQKQKVVVKEFAPTTMYTRSSNGAIEVKQEYEAQYKSLMADFYDLHKKLAVIKSSILVPVQEIIGENNTVYIIYKHNTLVTLDKYLNTAGEDMTYEETLDYFMPFFESLLELHNEGIVHCGISPETIFVDKNFNLFLLGFDTQAARTLKSDMDVGTWTDVYSIASVLYYCFTSVRPPRAIDRHKRDTLVPCHSINGNVPRQISAALEKAMAINTDTRTQTIENFLTSIGVNVNKQTTSNKGSGVKEFVPSQKDKSAHVATKKPFPYMLVSTIVTTVILCTGGVFLFKSLFAQELNDFIDRNFNFGPTSVTEADRSGNVPDFVGQKFVDVKSNKENRELFTFVEKYTYDEEHEEGIIIEQTPDSSALVADTKRITVTISKGSKYTTVPNIKSMDTASAMAALKEAGITNFKFVSVETSGCASGEVVSCTPDVGTRFNKEKGYIEVLYQE